MTQEEFDALDDGAPEQTSADAPTDVSPKSSFVGSAITAVRAQRPVRLAALGVAVLGGAFALTTMLGSSDGKALTKAQASAEQTMERTAGKVTQPLAAATASVTANKMPSLPSDPEPAAALAPALIRKIENLQPTQAIIAAPDCSVKVDAMPLAGAIVTLDIAAPCDGAARADVFQGDLQIAIVLDADGMAQVEMPALSAMATIAVAVADRDPVSLVTPVTDMADYARTVLYWENDAGLELHAFEGDADYGTNGHIAPETPHNIARVLSGNGGYLVTLGDATLDDARMALVYTAPASQAVDISIEAPVLAKNCGQNIFAGTIRTVPGITPVVQGLTFNMPGCEAEGEFVMLGDLVTLVAQVDLASN